MTSSTAAKSTSAATADTTADSLIEDEDALLYGDAAPSIFAGADSSRSDKPGSKSSSFWRKHMKKIKPTYWAILLKDDGSLEIRSIPDFTLKFVIQNFNHGEK